MFRNILLPLDGSHFSELALPLAIRISKAANAHLHIVRVHVPPTGSSDAPAEWDFDELVRERERDHLRAAVDRAHASGVEAGCELLEGPVARGIERYITALGIDLVVMTTHGRSGLKRAVFGSVAEQCIRMTHAPLLLLHPRSAEDEVTTQPESVRRVLIALDGSEEAERVLTCAVECARLTGARITLARVATAPFDIAATIGAEALREYLEKAREQALEYLKLTAARMPSDIRVDTIAVTSDRPAEGILSCRDDTGADLIALSTHGRSGWSRIAVGSVAEAVLHRAPVPVLILRPPSVDTAGKETDAAVTTSAEIGAGQG